VIADSYPAELHEAFALSRGLSPESPLPDDAYDEFITWVRAVTLRHLAVRLTRTGEWVCLINDALECRIQRAHLTVPPGWELAWRYGV